MKLVRNIAVIATLASVFAFASCGTTKAAAAEEPAAEAAVEEAAPAEATEEVAQ